MPTPLITIYILPNTSWTTTVVVVMLSQSHGYNALEFITKGAIYCIKGGDNNMVFTAVYETRSLLPHKVNFCSFS